MFEQATLPSGPAGKRVWTTFAGLAGQIALAAFAALVPVLSPQILPKAQFSAWLAPPGAPPPPAPVGKNFVRPRGTVRAKFQFRENVLYAYTKIPDRIAIIEEEPLGANSGPGVPGGVPGGVDGGTPGSVLSDVLRQTAVPPPPKPAVAAPPPKPVEHAAPPLIRRGGDVQMANLIQRIDPVYPPIARQARISGVVELVGIVGTDGRIRELRAKSGHPMLVKAAMDAVRQWIYRPTLLNGEPVEVEAPITVTFRLSQ